MLDGRRTMRPSGDDESDNTKIIFVVRGEEGFLGAGCLDLGR